MLTAWDDRVCNLATVSEGPFTLTISFSLWADNMPLTLTNVYTPTLRDEKQVFLAELVEVAGTVHGAWMVLGDFNLTRCPTNKNTNSFNSLDADHFNDLIISLALIEIPLVDRAFTWSNRRENPTLARLDRCFVNLNWDESFPNTALSLTRFASDHVPLDTAASTSIPRSVCFRFENAWLMNRQFPPVVQAALSQPAAGHVAKSFVLRLKHCLSACRSWSPRQLPLDQREHDTKVLINAL